MREKMEENRIVRVTEVEITEAAFAEGRRVTDALDSLRADSSGLNAFIEGYQGEIRFIEPGTETIRLLEQQLIDAYLADTSGTYQDNVQSVRNVNGVIDSLLYTRPVVTKMPDGRDKLMGVWNIWLPRKELVMRISRDKEE